MRASWFLFLFLTLFSHRGYAYSEMVRHHYPNCIACHESPSGGGLLNAYGRTISSAVLSTWGSEKEARSFYGAIDHPWIKKYLNLGGDLRGLQFHTNSKTMMMGRFIRMQAGLEGAVKLGPVKLVSFFGKQEAGHRLVGESIRHYALYQPIPELSLRAGRFLPNFGLNVAEHTYPTRKGLGFDQGRERDQIELMWNGEKINTSAAFTKTVKTVQRKTQEKAATAQVNVFVFDSSRIGASVWIGKEVNRSRQVYGLHGILGFSEKLYYLTEFDFQSGFDRKHGLFHFSRLGYEITKGLHLLAIEEYQKSDFKNDKSLSNAFGLGAQLFPRPHFDLQMVWNKKRVYLQSEEYFDYAYLMLHYYF